jgi:hypothetical protein
VSSPTGFYKIFFGKMVNDSGRQSQGEWVDNVALKMVNLVQAKEELV